MYCRNHSFDCGLVKELLSDRYGHAATVIETEWKHLGIYKVRFADGLEVCVSYSSVTDHPAIVQSIRDEMVQEVHQQ